MWLLAIPISVFIVCLAVLDYMFLHNTKDIKKRVFYNLDAGLKVWWVRGHVCASIIYSGLLFYWLWKMEHNEDSNAGKKEDTDLLHLSLSAFIFYALFLVERAGNFVLDLF